MVLCSQHLTTRVTWIHFTQPTDMRCVIVTHGCWKAESTRHCCIGAESTQALLYGWLSGGQEGKLSGLFCAVLCATIVHSELHTHMNRPNSSLDWVLSHWAHFNVLRFIFLYVFFCVWLYILHACVLCSIVTRWVGPGGIEAWSLGPLLPSVLWHCWLGHLTCKTCPRYDL